MKPYLILLLALVLIASLLGTLPVYSASIHNDDGETEPMYVEGELIIGFTHPENDEAYAAQQENFQMELAHLGGEISEKADDSSFVVAHFGSDEQTEQALAKLASLPNIAYVERNAIYRAATPPAGLLQDREEQQAAPEPYLPNDPDQNAQWYLNQILYYRAPAPSRTHPCIVLIDSGVDYNHPDLAGKIYKGPDLIRGDYDPLDKFGQGTAAASVISAKTNNGNGISGISPLTNILAVRVLDDEGIGTTAKLVAGINWANNHATAAKCGGQSPKIYVINVVGPRSNAMLTAITTAKNKGRLVIAPVGDRNSWEMQYPAAFSSVYAVAGTEQNDNRTYSSNYDSQSTPWIDIAAPGYNIYTAKLNGAYGFRTSTAMSAAMIGATASRIWARYPNKTVENLMNQIKNTAEVTKGFGRNIKRLDLWGALENNARMILQGQVQDASSATNRAISGAKVTIKLGSTTVCSVLTNKAGYYNCLLPSKNTYSVVASKTGYVTNSSKVIVSERIYDADIALSPITGTSISRDWSVVLTWKDGWQPYEIGHELDLFAVKLLGVYECSSPVRGVHPNAIGKVQVGADSYEDADVENIQIYKSYGGVIMIWVSLWDQIPWKAASFITTSDATVSVYKNNVRVARIDIPKPPITSRSDLWYVGYINLDKNSWTKRNEIHEDNSTSGVVPYCIYTFVDP